VLQRLRIDLVMRTRVWRSRLPTGAAHKLNSGNSAHGTRSNKVGAADWPDYPVKAESVSENVAIRRRGLGVEPNPTVQLWRKRGIYMHEQGIGEVGRRFASWSRAQSAL